MEYIDKLGLHIGQGEAGFNMPAYLTRIYSILGENSVL